MACFEIPTEFVGVPPCLIELVPTASMIMLPEVAVPGPPAPLQYARIALKAFRDDVAEFVILQQVSARRHAESLWVPVINRLGIRAGALRNATRRRVCTSPFLVEAKPIIAGCLWRVADRHLNMARLSMTARPWQADSEE